MLYALSFSTYGADEPGTTSPSPSITTSQSHSNSTSTVVPTTPVIRTNPCNQILNNEAAKTSCNSFFNNIKAAGTQSSFGKAVVVSDADDLVNAVKNASANGTIIVLGQGVYEVSERLVINQRIALVGIKNGDTLPTIRMTSDMLEKKSDENSLVYLSSKESASSDGFYSAFINWEIKIDKTMSYKKSVYTIVGSGYPGEVRLYGNTFVHSDNNVSLDEFVSLSTPGNKVYIDSNQFNTSNLYFSAVYSDCKSCGEREPEPEVIITNNTLTSSDNAYNGSDYAFHLVNHTKFTIENNTASTSKANISIDIDLPNQAELQSSIRNNIAHKKAEITNRVIEIEQEGYKITGSLTISGNDYFDVEHEDYDSEYITLTEGKKVPASSSSATLSLSPSPASIPTSPGASTTPAATKNPCDALALNHDLTSYKTCNDFLANTQATGGDKNFSHAFAVHNATELLNAVERDHLDGKPFSGSIIILKAGTFTLPRQLRINHKIAFVGEKSGNTVPRVRAGTDFIEMRYEFNSLVYLKTTSSQTTSGFFTSEIIWDTNVDTEVEGIVLEAAIGSSTYSGPIRIFQNQFEHKLNKTTIYDYIMLKNAGGDTYIGHNIFDTTHLQYATIYAHCVNCVNFDPKLEIVSNHFTSKEDSERQTAPKAIEIKGYKRFSIERNEQKNTTAAAYIDVNLKNDTTRLEGFIRYNIALQGAPANQKEIKLHSFPKNGQPLNISGSLTTAPNTYYSINDSEGLIAHIGTTNQESSVAYQSTHTIPVATATSIKPTPTGQTVTKTSSLKPTPSLATATQSSTAPTAQSANICDPLKSTSNIIQTCKDFLENNNASGGGAFTKAVVVTNATELVDEVTERLPTAHLVSNKIVILQHGTYELPHTLEITHGIALVGETKNNASSVSASGSSLVTYPVIRAAEDFSAHGYDPKTSTYTEKHEKKALVYLHNADGTPTTGFFSHHIHWETTHPFGKQRILFNGAINSQSYEGKIRLYQNQFSQTNAGRNLQFINLINATGGAYINDNKFDTSHFNGIAIYAHCKKDSCQTSNPPLEINFNHFFAQIKPVDFGSLGAIQIKGYAQFKVLENQQETKYALGHIHVEDHKNIQSIDAYIKNNRAHPEAPESQRRIDLLSVFTSEDSAKITGKVHISGNANYIYEDYGYTLEHIDYTPYKGTVSTQIASSVPSTVNPAASTNVLPVTAGSITPTRPLVSATASASPSIPKHPCDDIKDDATAFAACDAFLKNEKASGPASSKPSFSHAFIVNSADSLKDAVVNERYDGKPFIGSIIILRPGTYQLSQPLLISHKVALIGEKDENNKLPTLQAADDFVPAGDGYSMVYLYNSDLPEDSGFYSTDLNWQARIPTRLGDSQFLSIIYSHGYKGDIRFYNNLFDHADLNSWAYHFLNLEENANQRIYIGSNTFDTSHVAASAIVSRGPFDTNNKARIDIEANTFMSSEQTVFAGTKAITLSRYQYLNIKDNIQKTSLAAGSIEVILSNYSEIKEASIRNNKASKDAPEDHRKIDLLLNSDLGAPIALFGSIDVVENDYYTFEKAAGLPAANFRYIAGKEAEGVIISTPVGQQVASSSAIEPSAPEPYPVTSSITPTKPPIAICDRDNIVSSVHVTSSEVDACRAFLKSNKASAGQSFDKAVVIDSASDLAQAVSGHFLTAGADASKLIVLKNGTYNISQSLNITHKIALVGVVKDGSYPVIRVADNFSTKSHDTRSLAYLYDDPAVVAKKGFYSHHIHWDATNPPGKALLLLMGAINSQSYKGEFRLHENQFSESKHDVTMSYIQLFNVTENTYINNNRFDTAYLKTAAIMVNCGGSRCVTAPPQLEISSNRFHSKAVSYRAQRPGMMAIQGFVRYKILDNHQETKDAAGSILVKDHSNTLHMDAYIQNNIAHSGAPEFERRILVESFFSPDKSIDITGKLHVSGNDYYKFNESGLDLKYVDYTPGKSLASSQVALSTPTQSVTIPSSSAYVFASLSTDSITPTQLLASATAPATASTTATVENHPCDDIKDDATAFATCDAFLKSEKASGPEFSKPTFSHAFIVDSSKSLMDAVNKGRFDGKYFIGSIIVLRPGTYELPEPLLINHRIALLGEKDKEGALPTIKAANNFSVPTGGQHALAYLYGSARPPSARPQDAGFFSFNLNWKISLPATTASSGTYNFESIISSLGYRGDIRLSNNHFGHDDDKVDSIHLLFLPNSGHRYYIGNNTFDTSRVIVNAIESGRPNSGFHEAHIDIESNSFTASQEPDYPGIKSIVLSRYQLLSVLDNVQETAQAAGSIEINFNNNEDIKYAAVRNNKAHKEAAKDQRTIWLKLNKGFRDTAVVSGSVDIRDNDYYEFSYSGLPKANFHHEYGKRVVSESSASLALSTTSSVTPTPSLNVPEVTTTLATQPVSSTPQTNPVTSKSRPAPSAQTQPLLKSTAHTKTPPLTSTATTESWLKPTTHTKAPPSLTSLCEQLKGTLEAQHCEKFRIKLKEMELDITFSEVVTVKNSAKLIAEAAGASESGKVILLHAGSYQLDQPLHIKNKVALVGIGNTVIKSAYTFSQTEARALLLLNDGSTHHGFYSHGITWDITAPGNPGSESYKSAIKAENYQGDIVILHDDFQYQSTEDNEEAPSHYIDVQKSTGNVRIADNIFFTGGLKESAIYANCKDCLKDDQYLDIVRNHFTDTEKVESTPVAIDVRYYKTLNIHRNVQKTTSAAAQINVVLPNYKDDINAVIKDNVAQNASDAEQRTIELTVGRIAQVPVSIGGSVKVFNNQCYFVREDKIPPHVLKLIDGSCSASAQAQQDGGSSGGTSALEYVKYTLGYGGGSIVATYFAALAGTGIYGRTNLRYHDQSRAAYLWLLKALTFCCIKYQAKGYASPAYDEEGPDLEMKLQGGTGVTDEKSLLTKDDEAL